MEIKSAALIVGLDVGRGYVVACPYSGCDNLPAFILKYKAVKAPATEAGLKKILELGEVYALEPTGKDHYWWTNQLEAAGKMVLIVSGLRVRSHARDRGITSKGDKEDAAAIGSYAMHHLERGNAKAFLSFDKTAQQIRELRASILQCQNHRTKLINQLKARLSVEAPELCKFEIEKRGWGVSTNQWKSLLANPDLSWISRDDIQLIEQIHAREARLEQALSKLIEPITSYREVWEKWQFNERQVSAILGALYPIEQFLSESGGAVISHTLTKDGKRIKLNHSLRSIQRCLGYGRIKYQSGDSFRWARTGDSSVRAALYLWISAKITIGRNLNRFRLHKKIGKPDDWEKWSEKRQDKWIEEHNFRALCEEWEPKVLTVRQLTKDRQRAGYLPWKDQSLINQVASFNDINETIAQIQLFYEFAHQGLNKHERILKTLPFMIRCLGRDLIEWGR